MVETMLASRLQQPVEPPWPTQLDPDYLVTQAEGVAGAFTLCDRCFRGPVLVAFGAEYKLEASAAAGTSARIDIPPVALPLFGPRSSTAKDLSGGWASLPGDRFRETNKRQVRQLARKPDATPVLIGTHALIFLRNALDSVPYVTSESRARTFGWLANKWVDEATGARPFAMSGFGKWFKEHSRSP
ncbi:uncharacterized protein AMSG_11489 [Thecamonas trahens ATCC 50062]|uniref:Uncharacterized protein n=1 Tax=Thecamonas trahens ATCC 50062 TaxID=461836 RepID=A0A0L0DVX2_THETB|nr:hypothetical protein AMSG_11489 [Thecamonas trahens ATCC 50062]KNC56226.1 hypothetical protein AMSG_11489 [Thecamonas trahens ATCC 50062]|eukprot:XP_013752654.1 hypothetical protein AMSG_11489 [Thecamonas trahens ATCC 50062]